VTGVVEQVHSKDQTPPEGGPIDCVLFDLDGVVYHGSRAIDGAVDGISWLHERSIGVNYVTNNATRHRRRPPLRRSPVWASIRRPRR
jgi:glycerol 3-phosphatase-2